MHKLVWRCGIGLGLAAAVFSATAHAKNVTASVPEVAAALTAAGYKAELKAEDDGTFIQSAAGGYGFRVFFYGCEPRDANCKSIQFFAGFKPKTKPTLRAMNAYAAENRWGRVYLDKEGDPIIEMDLDLEQGGMSEALFRDNLAYFEAVMGMFATFVFSNDA
jgi:hypothetical protein